MTNNPIWYNDILGDTIKITHRRGFLGLKKETLTYNNGNLYKKNGDKYTGKVKGFLKSVVNDLNELQDGATGKELVNSIVNSKHILRIEKTSGDSKQHGRRIEFNPNNTSSGLDTSGSVNTKTFVILGHEMAHFYDKYLDNNNNQINPLGTWFKFGNKIVHNSEKFAVNVENLIRHEHNLPLRTHYALTITNKGSYFGTGKYNLMKIGKISKQYVKSLINYINFKDYMNIKPEISINQPRILNNKELYTNQ